MAKRDVAFLLIGLGPGFTFAVAMIFAPFLNHHMFIFGFSWGPGWIVLALPFVLVAVGLVLLAGKRRVV